MMWIYHKDDINIIEASEIEDHSFSRGCLCKPTISEFNGKVLIIHTCAHKLDEQTKKLFKQNANSELHKFKGSN